MGRIWWSVALAFAAVACTSTVAEDDKDKDKDKPAGKGKVVTLDGLKSRTPDGWVSEKPSNKMRMAQFKLPKQKGDEHDGEVVIFKGITGTAAANVKRWKDQFVPPKGKKMDDVAKVKEIKVAGNDATVLDVSGTYQFNPAPFNPKSKTEMRPGYRMIAVQFEGPDEVYHIKMTGPAKTVEHYAKGFDAWLKGFKK